MFERPTLLGNRYRLRESIGRGGMGQVWLARDETLGRDVAIKQITPPPDKPNSRLDTLSRMALHEAQAAAQLTGPHTVHVYDIVQFEAMPWIVMEHVPSRSLHDIITQTGPLPPAYVATIGLAILDALLAAHRAGVLHRDVTPRNVLIGSGGRIVLCDFGLASWNASGDSPDREVRGTAGYVAPERAVAGTSSAEGDFWSLGATLYAAVEGHAPYARRVEPRSAAKDGTRKPPCGC